MAHTKAGPFVTGAAPALNAGNMNILDVQYDDAMRDVAAGGVQVKGQRLTPYHFGAVNPVTGSDNTAALNALFAAAAGTAYPSGCEIYIPPGIWRYNSSVGLPLTSNLVVKGASDRTRVSSVGTSGLFEWNTTVSNVNFESLFLESAVAGKAIFNPAASGGIFRSTFKQLYLLASTDTSQIWNMNAASQTYIQNTFQDCMMQRTGTSTVVPFQIINSAGAANFNEFNQVRINGNNNVNTPFFHIESTPSASYAADWTWINILGEQNPGGMIRALAAFNWTIINATDEDATVNYVAPLIDFRPNSSSFASANITIMNSGRRGSAMAAGVSDISVNTTGANVSIVNCNNTSSSVNTVLTLPLYSNVIATRGYPGHYSGTGTPEGSVTGVVGSTFSRMDGGASTSFYVKESGTGNTGWIAK